MGIELGSNFDQKAALPLDSRTVQATIVARDAIPPSIRHDGLEVYVEENGNNYQLQGGIDNTDWVLLESGGAGITAVVDDTTPELGGDLDATDHAISNTTTVGVTEQGVTPTTPASGKGMFYAKTDGKPYFLNDAGEEKDLTATKLEDDDSPMLSADLDCNSQVLDKVDTIIFDSSNGLAHSKINQSDDGDIYFKDKDNNSLATLYMDSKLSLDQIQYREITTPTTPLSNNAVMYTKSDKKPYFMADDGVEVDLSASGGASSTYTGTANLNVGGFVSGTTYTGLDLQECMDQLLSPEVFGVLTPPSNTISNSFSGYREIGTVTDIDFTATFNRGSINPQGLSTSAFRSGLPNTYSYTGTDLPATVASTSLSDSQTITGYTVLSGTQSWTGTVSYDEGVQPVGDAGTDFDAPLPAGTTSSKTTTVIGVYPYFATTVAIDTTAKQSLVAMTTNVETSMVAEDGVNKQVVEFPQGWKTIDKLEQFNTLSGSWDEIALSSFTKTSTTKTIQGNTVNYDVYTHNGGTIGDRRLRWS